jgi:hypothetical protein
MVSRGASAARGLKKLSNPLCLLIAEARRALFRANVFSEFYHDECSHGRDERPGRPDKGGVQDGLVRLTHEAGGLRPAGNGRARLTAAPLAARDVDPVSQTAV